MLSFPFRKTTFLCCTLLLPVVITLGQDSQTNGGETCKVLSGPEGTVTGTISDPTGARIGSAIVELVCGNTRRTARTGPDGSYSIKMQPGSYELQVGASGFAVYHQIIALTAGGSATQDVSLKVGQAGSSVQVTADTGFVPYTSDAGSKTGAILSEVPQTISVISQRELEARNVTSLMAALQYTPGVKSAYDSDSRFDWFYIRGFDSGSAGIFRDGMRWSAMLAKIDPFELQSIEVIQGPASVLYGQVPPGGMVNLTTKEPRPESHREVGVQYGQYDRRQVQGDFIGSFDPHQVWQYRLLGLVRNSGTQVNFTPDNRRLIAPSLSWNPDSRTRLTFLGDWQHDNTKWLQFLPESGTLTSNPNGPIPISAFVGEPGWEKVIRDQASAASILDHQFANGWDVHQNYRYQHVNYWGSTLYGGGFISGSNSVMTRYPYAFNDRNDAHTLDTRALKRYTTSNWQHTVLGGFDYLHQRTHYRLTSAPSSTINIYHPVYGMNVPTTLTAILQYNQLAQQYGVYLQDQIKYKQRLVLSLGGREDWAVTDYSNLLANTYQYQNKSKFTGRAGVLYLTPWGLHPYYSYSTSFQPVTGSTDYYGKQFSPTYGQQQEGGVKFQPRTWNSYITASLYTITQHNVLVTDPAHTNFSIQTGAIRSRGFELEGVANLSRGWNLHAGYSFDATKITETTITAQLGNQSPLVPRHSVSALADYTVPEGRFAGLGGNFGTRFTGSAYGDTANAIPMPNYTLFDGSLRYSLRGIQFVVSGSNLADKHYVVSCGSVTSCYYGNVRNMIGSVKYKF